MQFIFGVIFLRTDFGLEILTYMRMRIDEFTKYADTGSAFSFSEKYKDFSFIFMVSSTVTEYGHTL